MWRLTAKRRCSLPAARTCSHARRHSRSDPYIGTRAQEYTLSLKLCALPTCTRGCHQPWTCSRPSCVDGEHSCLHESCTAAADRRQCKLYKPSSDSSPHLWWSFPPQAELQHAIPLPAMLDGYSLAALNLHVRCRPLCTRPALRGDGTNTSSHDSTRRRCARLTRRT